MVSLTYHWILSAWYHRIRRILSRYSLSVAIVCGTIGLGGYRHVITYCINGTVGLGGYDLNIHCAIVCWTTYYLSCKFYHKMIPTVTESDQILFEWFWFCLIKWIHTKCSLSIGIDPFEGWSNINLVILLRYNSTKISLSFSSRTVGTCQFDVQPHIVYDPIGLIGSVGYLPDILGSIEQDDGRWCQIWLKISN
jgi:hypothetical protein